MQRTVRFRLKPTPKQAELLRETLRQHTECFNAVTAYGFENKVKNGVALHKETYYPLRERFCELPSQLICAARVKATEAVASALALLKKGKRVSQPKSSSCPIRYDARTYRIMPEGTTVSLATIDKRQKVELVSYPYAQEQLAKAISFDSADLFERDGNFFLHVVLTLPESEAALTGEVVGIDFGITRPAVASNNRFFGERRWKNIERRYFKRKRSLQSKGTKSAKRRLRQLARKVNRFRSDCDHVVSKRIVQSVPSGTVIVVENLTEIRTRMKARKGSAMKRQMHQWPFARLRVMLEYKAQGRGSEVVGIDPRHTSQTCHHCSFKHRNNRRSQSLFRCRECGFECNADLNASRNIAQKYLATLGKSESSGLLSISLLSRTSVQGQAPPLVGVGS
jgi:putative transposase